MENNHVTVLEIDGSALDFNLNYFKSKLHSNTKILIVVKAFGYGSSATQVAKYLDSKVDYFAVAYTDEAIVLREAGIATPILVLHPQKRNLDKIIQYNLEPNIYSIRLLKSFIEIAGNNNAKDYPIHIKLNSGLNRLGFAGKEIPSISAMLAVHTEVKVKSVFSHIAASEDLNERNFTLRQIKVFNEYSNKLIHALEYKPFKHLLNTSGIINYSNEAQFEMVRLGIGLLGFGNDENHTNQLKNVLTLKSVISQIHTIKKGETVGYNRAFTANSTMKTATIPIGHADGISRKFGNGVGYVFIHDKKAPIVGNVCMDMLMVDISQINCNEGDEVVIFKNQQNIEDMALKIKTISYEILTAISQRVNRKFIKRS